MKKILAVNKNDGVGTVVDTNVLTTNRMLSIIAMPDNRMVITGANGATVVFAMDLAQGLAREIVFLSDKSKIKDRAIATSVRM